MSAQVSHHNRKRTIDIYAKDKFMCSIEYRLLQSYSDIARRKLPRTMDWTKPRTPENERLDVTIDEVWDHPSSDSFRFACDWMMEARADLEERKQFKPYGVGLDFGLHLKVDAYATALCLGMSPDPWKLRREIYARLQERPVSLDQVKYIHERLPIEDKVVWIMLLNFVQRRDLKAGWYSEAERTEIEEYIHNEDPALCHQLSKAERYNEHQLKDNEQGRSSEVVQGERGKGVKNEGGQEGTSRSAQKSRVEDPDKAAGGSGRKRWKWKNAAHKNHGPSDKTFAGGQYTRPPQQS